jgi:hypothetical protein
MDDNSGMPGNQSQRFGADIGSEKMEVQDVVPFLKKQASELRNVARRKFSGGEGAYPHPLILKGLRVNATAVHGDHLGNVSLSVEIRTQAEQERLRPTEVEAVDHMENPSG